MSRSTWMCESDQVVFTPQGGTEEISLQGGHLSFTNSRLSSGFAYSGLRR